MGFIENASEDIMAEEDANFIKMIDDIIKRKNMEETKLSSNIKKEIYKGLNTNTSIIITKTNKTGATSFILKMLEELHKDNISSLYIEDKEKRGCFCENLDKDIGKVEVDFCIDMKSLKTANRIFESKKYKVIVFDEATYMDLEKVNNISNKFNGLKVFIINNDDNIGKMKNICFTGKKVEFSTYSFLDYNRCIKKENTEIDLDLSRKIQDEILYKYNHSITDINIVITKERQVGATMFTLKCLDELSRIGYKCLFVVPGAYHIDPVKQNYHKKFKKTCSVDIKHLENIKDRETTSKNYNVVCFDEATFMNPKILNEILKDLRGVKVFTIQKDDDRVKDICFSGQFVGFKVSNPIEFQDPVDFKFQQEGKNETDYIPTALDNNIDYLISLLKERLNDNYYIKTADNVFVKNQVFTDKQFKTFLTQSLSSFNQTPTFTNYYFTDCTFVRIFADILVQGALVQCLGSQAVRERAHEFTTVNNGVLNSCPDISTMLFDQYAIEINSYYNKLSDIKQGLVVDGKLAGLKGF